MPFAPDNIPRAKALAEVLCAAAYSDDDLDPDEREAVKKELAALLGPLHPEVETHVDRFDPRHFDLTAALTRVHASALDEKRAVMRGVRSIIRADGAVREVESNFLAKVGAFLRIPPADID